MSPFAAPARHVLTRRYGTRPASRELSGSRSETRHSGGLSAPAFQTCWRTKCCRHLASESRPSRDGDTAGIRGACVNGPDNGSVTSVKEPYLPSKGTRSLLGDPVGIRGAIPHLRCKGARSARARPFSDLAAKGHMRRSREPAGPRPSRPEPGPDSGLHGHLRVAQGTGSRRASGPMEPTFGC